MLFVDYPLYKSNQRIRSVPSLVVVVDVALGTLGGSRPSPFPSRIPLKMNNTVKFERKNERTQEKENINIEWKLFSPAEDAEDEV